MISPGHAMTSLDGQFLSIDDQFCDILGRDRSEIIGKTIIEVTLHADRAENAAKLESLRKHREPFTIRKTYVRGDGSLIKVQNHVDVMTDGLGGDRLIATVVPLVSGKIEFEVSALLRTARTLAEERRSRCRLLATELRSDDFFYLLLSVYILEAEGRSTVSSKVCEHAEIDVQAGILALWQLIGKGFLHPEGRSLNLAEVGLSLTTKGDAVLTQHLRQLRETGTLV
jgi:PAS domain S-box-containing protein